MNQFVYILTNPAMPDLIKIGITSNQLTQRIAELSRASGVPLPFEIYYASEVENMEEVEKRIHDAFDDFRINPKREFFNINPERVVSILKLVEKKDVTPREDVADTKEELTALHLAQNRRARFNFTLAQIPIGAKIAYYHDNTKFAEVVSNTEVKYENEIFSLNRITLKLLENSGRIWKAVHGPAYWIYENETLDERRKRLEQAETI